jgi:hypothetical protein
MKSATRGVAFGLRDIRWRRWLERERVVASLVRALASIGFGLLRA